MDELSDLPLDSLRRLARGLLYDRERAEDVVQEAWLAALRHAPAPENLRGWLTGAVRRIARSTGREERRRAFREERAARPEALPSAADATARIEILRALLDAVDALDEPYRAAIVLRYFDELPPRAIAQRLGVPVNTARTHVRRGLERLRRQLDGERGEGRQGLLAALVPFAGGVPWSGVFAAPGALSWGPLSTGALIVKTPVIVVVLALAAGMLWLQRRDSRKPAQSPAGATVEQVAQREPERESTTEPLVVNTREALDEGAAETAPSWVVRGHIQRGSGAPYPGVPLLARVHAGFGLDGTVLEEERLAADEHGDFEWSLVPSESSVTVWVRPDLPDHEVHECWETVARGAPPPQLLLATAVPLDAWISGHVLSPSRELIPHATVKAGSRASTTDSGGRFELRTSSHWSDTALSAGAKGFGEVRVRVEAIAPAEQRSIEVVLAAELCLRGRVTDQKGQPVPAVKVTAPGYLEEVTSTDPEGRFELGGWAVGSSWVSARFEKEGYAPVYRGWKPEGSLLEVEIALGRGRRIDGRVSDASRRPIEGAEVGIGFSTNAWVICAYTDTAGRFAFEHAPEEFVRLEAWHRRLGACVVELDDPAIRADALELVLDAGHFLGGTRLDPEGQPVPWARVSAARWYISRGVRARADLGSQVTDARGRFRFDGLPEGEVELSASVGDFAGIEERVAALDRVDLVLRFEGRAGLAGRVIDAASGNAIRSFAVRTVQGDNGNRRPPGSDGEGFEALDGTWRISDDLIAGRRFLVEISAAGFAPGYSWVVSAPDPDPEACLVRLSPGARVVGHVVDRNTRQPAAGALVRQVSVLDRIAVRTPIETHADAEGAFELRDLPPGEMTLRVECQGLTAVDGPFVVTGQETTERWIEVGAGGRIHGRLLDALSAGIGGASVTAYGAEVVGDETRWSTITAPDGSYEFTGLPSGLFQVQWARDLDGQKVIDLERLVQLPGGAEVEVELRPRGGATVRGELVSSRGALPRTVPVYLVPRRETPMHWADGNRGGFAVDGRFEIAHLEPGSWTILAHSALADGTPVSGSVLLDVPVTGEVETILTLEPRP